MSNKRYRLLKDFEWVRNDGLKTYVKDIEVVETTWSDKYCIFPDGNLIHKSIVMDKTDFFREITEEDKPEKVIVGEVKAIGSNDDGLWYKFNLPHSGIEDKEISAEKLSTLSKVIEDHVNGEVEKRTWLDGKLNCTLSDDELVEKVNWWVGKLAETGGRAWTLRVPVDLNHDPDVLITELGKRYKAACTAFMLSGKKKDAEQSFQWTDELALEFGQKLSQSVLDGNTYTHRYMLNQFKQSKSQPTSSVSAEDEVIAFGKRCFYKGFEKCEKDDANCYTAWRECAGNLIKTLSKDRIGQDNICPVTKRPCDDETCSVGAECNLSGNQEEELDSKINYKPVTPGAYDGTKPGKRFIADEPGQYITPNPKEEFNKVLFDQRGEPYYQTRDWEIVKVIHPDTKEILGQGDGSYANVMIREAGEGKSKWKIHSVRRLSDQEVFSVGGVYFVDQQMSGTGAGNYKINSFFVQKDKLFADVGHSQWVEFQNLQRSPSTTIDHSRPENLDLGNLEFAEKVLNKIYAELKRMDSTGMEDFPAVQRAIFHQEMNTIADLIKKAKANPPLAVGLDLSALEQMGDEDAEVFQKLFTKYTKLKKAAQCL